MAEPFMAEIRIVSFNYPPKWWALCNGQLLPINANQALFALLGTTFGGDGQVNFALPNLQGRTPIHMGNGHTLGEASGEPSHTLTTPELPQHQHTLSALNAAGTSADPSSAAPAVGMSNLYGAPGALAAASPASLTNVGGSQAHTNMQPYLALTFCIALQGIFPSQT